MKKQTTPTAKKKRSKRLPETETVPIAAPVLVPEPAVATPTVHTMPVPVVAHPGRGRSEATKLGAELVRYLRIHAKHPYGERGMAAIVRLARQVGHAALQEISAS